MSGDSCVFEGPADKPAAPRDHNPPRTDPELSFAFRRTGRFGHVRLRGEVSRVNH